MKRKSLLFLLLMALFAPLAMNGQTSLLTENFDEMSSISTSYSSTGWYAYNAGSGNNWSLNTSSSYANSGTKSAQYQYNSSNSANCYLVSAPFSVSSNMSEVSVSLYERVRGSGYAETFEVFFVKASDVTNAASVASVTQYSAIASASYTNTEFALKTSTVTNSALAGQSVRVVVHCTSATDRWYLYIDDITVTETTSSSSYITEINNDNDWNSFAQSVRNGLDYSGKNVNLNANISINSQANLAGTSSNPFKGSFNGNGNTITLNITATENKCAPFHTTQNATFQNLVIDGTINTSFSHAGGLIGSVHNGCSITNCISKVTINSSLDDKGVDGGFIAQVEGDGGNVTITGCVFAGSLLGSSTKGCGGFVGWSTGHFSPWAQSGNATIVFTDCLFAPISVTMDQSYWDNYAMNSPSATFARGFHGGNSVYNSESNSQQNYCGLTFNNCYYTQAFGTQQGTRAYSVTATSPATVVMAGDPSTQYSVSGIKVYNPGITITTNNNTTIYAASGQTLNLTLGGGSDYEADYGTLEGSGNSYSLTLEANNTVISAITAPPASIPYTENFENGQNGWEFVNGTRTNKWCYGAAGAHDGSNGLFISNNGTTNEYTHSASAVWAYREIKFEETKDYIISFDWKANGEECCDYLRAGLVPASTTLVDGTDFSAPTGWIDLNEGNKMNVQSSWQTKTTTINVTAGTYKLAFCWRNDGSVGSNPPAAIDNIDIHEAAYYNVTVSANGSGTVSGDGNNIAEGTSVTVTATPNASNNFINWTENGTEVSTDASYTFTLEGDRNLVANFEAWTVSIASEPASLVNLPFGTEVVLTASSNIRPQSLGEYTFSTGVDASKWYNVTSTTNIMDGTTSGDYAVSTVHTFGEGFTFPFAGTNYTQFSVNADGNLRLGGTVTGTSYYTTPFSSSNANYDNPKINGMGFDGYFDVSTYGNYVHAQIFGEAPNRVFVVEFKESPYSSSYRQYTWNWQVQLSEDGTIQIVYGDTAPGSYYNSNQIGLCINASDGWTVSTSTHEATHFTNGTSTTNASATSWPGNNRYYRFSPVTYEWTYTGTVGTANGNVYTVTPTENSSYTVSVTHNGTTLTETVEVTMQALTKTIEAYTGERGGYYLIASPVGTVTPSADNGFLNGTYDLYYFDQNAWDMVDNENVLHEWRNYDVENFSIASGKGYLYANKEGTTLTFTGTPYSGNGEVTLSKTEGPRFSGWNLVGNPFAQTAYFTNDFYTLNEDRDEVVAGETKSVEAMEGIFVVAANDGETMTFSTTSLGKSNSQMSINVVRNRGNVIDRAIVRFDEESLLPKFQLNPNHTKVYIPQDGSDYAVVYADGAGTMPVNFKAEENGHYTLNFTTENVNFNYLHLIDNRNGNDVDLLQTPYYTFDAKSTDYASRFTLVFATGNDNDDTFAFFNNGVWIINNDGDATLQVVDALGRVLSSESISGSTSKAINVAPGVYMLRLINGDKVKVQKIVVKR